MQSGGKQGYMQSSPSAVFRRKTSTMMAVTQTYRKHKETETVEPLELIPSKPTATDTAPLLCAFFDQSFFEWKYSLDTQRGRVAASMLSLTDSPETKGNGYGTVAVCFVLDIVLGVELQH